MLSSQVVIIFIFGVAFVITLLVLAIAFPKPTPFQYNTFRIILSLAAAGVAAMIPGFITLEFSPVIDVLIRAGGALAIFILIFFFNPAQLTTQVSEPSQRPMQVAAVCYRITDKSIEFLLVRTTGGRWTFPKGKVKPDEESWFAAQREAFEEAGVSGDIEHQPFTTYLHQKKEWKTKGIEIKVQAFLLQVEMTQKTEEKHRKPTWFSAAEAEAALAEDRQFKYASEFKRVLQEAINRLTDARKED